MENFLKDLGFAARALWKNPAFAATALLTLALGIGASTAIFSVVNAVLLRPLPYPHADRLVLAWVSAWPSGRSRGASCSWWSGKDCG